LPLDLPLHQSLPICLSSSASTQEGQIAAASGSAAVVVAAVAAAPAAVVAFVTIEVRGAGLEHGKKKEEANICLYSSINVSI